MGIQARQMQRRSPVLVRRIRGGELTPVQKLEAQIVVAFPRRHVQDRIPAVGHRVPLERARLNCRRLLQQQVVNRLGPVLRAVVQGGFAVPILRTEEAVVHRRGLEQDLEKRRYQKNI